MFSEASSMATIGISSIPDEVMMEEKILLFHSSLSFSPLVELTLSGVYYTTVFSGITAKLSLEKFVAFMFMYSHIFLILIYYYHKYISSQAL